MNDRIRHRGQDDEGYISIDENEEITLWHGDDSVNEVKKAYEYVQNASDTKLAMGFRRLAIIDLSYCGHQPMVSEDGQLVLTFNGEIYNYKELRRELEDNGFVFKSRSDTEVILQGFRYWGYNVLKYLNGMFTIVIYDHANRKLFIARDRLGIKPLFYHYDENGITWASEIKSVLQAPWVPRQVDWQNLFLNYQLQTTPSPYTCFANIHSLEPASWMEVDIYTGNVKVDKYWYIPLLNPPVNITLGEAVDYLDKKLQQIVNIQLRSDVPVTSLMSGGIDSTTLTAICAKQNNDFRCYTLGFDGTGHGADEIPQAKAMAQKLSIKHYTHLVKPADILVTLDGTLRHFEEPYTSLEPGVVVSEYLHNQGYRVVMNGLGADEVFGGYAHYIEYRKWLLRKQLAMIRTFIPSLGDFPRKLKNYLGLDSILKYFINSRPGMRVYEIQELAKNAFRPAGTVLYESGAEKPKNVPVSLFYYDLKYYIGSHHVYRDDLSAMKYGLEVRYPYLDHELIEWVSTLPLSIRFSDKITKPLLRKVSERYITPANLNMPKRGFNIPLGEWMRNNDAIQDYTRQKLNDLQKREIFRDKVIEKWWQRRKEDDYFTRLWQLVTTEVWLNEYIES